MLPSFLYIMNLNLYCGLSVIFSINLPQSFSLDSLFCGINLCITFVLIPNNPYSGFCQIALFIDLGYLPIVIGVFIRVLINKHTTLPLLVRYKKKKKYRRINYSERISLPFIPAGSGNALYVFDKAETLVLLFGACREDYK